MQKTETILLAPLNWGLGHATRCVPLISGFLNAGHQVLMAGHGASFIFLKKEFPHLTALPLNGYSMRYSLKRNLFFLLLLQMPLFLGAILWEHWKLKKIIRNYAITQVVADNRYGLWNKKVRSVLITHQLFIQLPKSLGFIAPLLHGFTRLLIHRFDECWVPDFEDPELSLSGVLSHGKPLPKNVRFIGPLSRFSNYKFPQNFIFPDLKPNVLILISGPEPFRSCFEKEMEERFAKSRQSVLMVCGKPGEELPENKVLTDQGTLIKVSHLSTPDLCFILKNTPQIISLAGYSTLMDLHALGRQAELIPTPGQTEQEYLVSFHNSKNNPGTR
ncbi:MAG: glycosyl transferase family 28 [Bacteroidetes bacterium HGW-Bacteroidetes-4]|jgi:UDP:flavonoid glycosyltransferase YjiC (YdhE family)|nr:MAG: glycosyl transferase family 28 [Bacteroidetes bacterium HGW-Bacteroidetes-4]